LRECADSCYQRLSRDAFASDLAASRLRSDLDALRDMPVDDLAQLYRDVLTDLLNRHYQPQSSRFDAASDP